MSKDVLDGYSVEVSDEMFRGTLESFARASGDASASHTYSELREQKVVEAEGVQGDALYEN